MIKSWSDSRGMGFSNRLHEKLRRGASLYWRKSVLQVMDVSLFGWLKKEEESKDPHCSVILRKVVINVLPCENFNTTSVKKSTNFNFRISKQSMLDQRNITCYVPFLNICSNNVFFKSFSQIPWSWSVAISVSFINAAFPSCWMSGGFILTCDSN